MQSDSDDSQAYSVKDFGPQLARRRASISAENLSPVNADPDCTIIQKTDDEANRINSILTTNVLFQHLNHDQKKKIQDAMFPVVRGDKEIIIKQGDAGDNFYIIEVGIVDVFIENKDTPMKQVATYSVGDSFGELAIMYNAPRAATCIANGEVRLWALDRVSFKMILMETAVAKRIEYTNFLRQIPVLKQLNEYELLTIADVLEEEVFSENDVICVEGDQGDRFYFIRDGIAICTERSIDGSKKEIARLSTGSFFGEVSSIA
jgi:cAMP-dependent protein kinase regulator